MQPPIDSATGLRTDATVFIAELIRLQREVRKVGQELDRIESEMRRALAARQHDRVEEYR